MTIIITVDDHMGTMFNHRRQSRDRALIGRVLALAEGQTLRMSPYSAVLFPEDGNIAVSEDFLADAEEDDICFVEDADILPYSEQITRLFLFRWNRDYPADTFLPLALDGWQMVGSEEFPGSSHERITMEEYIP